MLYSACVGEALNDTGTAATGGVPIIDVTAARHALRLPGASALLGLLSYVVGAAVVPLAGIGGTHTAVPTATDIAVLGAAAAATFAILTRIPPVRAIPGRISA